MGFGDGGGSPEPIQGRSGRLWVPNKDSSKWSSHLYRIYATDDSLVLGNVMGFTVSMLGHNSQRTSRSFGIDLTGAQVEEGLFSGRFEDLGSLELQPGFILTDAHEERHFFGVSSREEQKKWVACLRGLTSLNESLTSIGEAMEDGQTSGVVKLTARSIITLNGHGAEHVRDRSEKTWAQERELYTRSLELKVKDLESEKQGVQEALKAALLMLSERFSQNPSGQNAHSNTVHSSEPDIVTPRLESVALEIQQSEKTMSDLVYELSSMVQQRDAALLALKTIRGEDVYSDVGSEYATTPSTIPKKVGSFQKSAFTPEPITLPEGEEPLEPAPLNMTSESGTLRANSISTTPRVAVPCSKKSPRKGYSGSMTSRDSGDKGNT